MGLGELQSRARGRSWSPAHRELCSHGKIRSSNELITFTQTLTHQALLSAALPAAKPERVVLLCNNFGQEWGNKHKLPPLTLSISSISYPYTVSCLVYQCMGCLLWGTSLSSQDWLVMWLLGSSASLGEINPDSHVTPIPILHWYFSRNEWNFMRTACTSDASQHFSAKQIITFCRQKYSSDVSLPLPETENCAKRKFSFTQLICLLQLSAKYCPQWYLLPMFS